MYNIILNKYSKMNKINVIKYNYVNNKNWYNKCVFLVGNGLDQLTLGLSTTSEQSVQTMSRSDV